MRGITFQLLPAVLSPVPLFQCLRDYVLLASGLSPRQFHLVQSANQWRQFTADSDDTKKEQQADQSSAARIDRIARSRRRPQIVSSQERKEACQRTREVE